MSIKVVSLINSFVSVLAWIIVCGADGFGISKTDDFVYGIYFYVSSFLIDVIYFIFVFLLNYCLIKDDDSNDSDDNKKHKNQYRNVWQPFLILYQTNPRIILFIVVISVMWFIIIW